MIGDWGSSRTAEPSAPSYWPWNILVITLAATALVCLSMGGFQLIQYVDHRQAECHAAFGPDARYDGPHTCRITIVKHQ